jgi:hypothetical protein
VIPGTHGIAVPVLVDHATGLTIARHRPSQSMPRGCLVIGREPWPAAAGEEPRRLVADAERQAILDLLPPALRAAAAGEGARWTAGWRTVPREAPRGPWVARFKEQPQLIAALPGEATLSFLTATLVKDEVEKLLGRERPETEEMELGAAEMRPWTGHIANHYEPAYQTLNERPTVSA